MSDLNQFAVFGEWFAGRVDGCTCAGGTPESSYLHEPNCGWEPLAKVADVEAALGVHYRKAAEAERRLKEREAALVRAKDADLDDARDEIDDLRMDNERLRAAVQAVRGYLDETTDVSPPMLMRKSILAALGTVGQPREDPNG